MFGRREDLPLSHGHVFFAPRHHKNGLLSPHRCLNVGVGLGSEGLDLAACRRNKTDIKRGITVPYRIIPVVIYLR